VEKGALANKGKGKGGEKGIKTPVVSLAKGQNSEKTRKEGETKARAKGRGGGNKEKENSMLREGLN